MSSKLLLGLPEHQWLTNNTFVSWLTRIKILYGSYGLLDIITKQSNVLSKSSADYNPETFKPITKIPVVNKPGSTSLVPKPRSIRIIKDLTTETDQTDQTKV